MVRAGRANWLIIAGLACLVVIVGFLFIQPPSPSAAGHKFLKALADGDAKTLAQMSYSADGESLDDLEKKWNTTVTEYGPHYRWAARILREAKSSDDQATVVIEIERNAPSYEEKMELPMVRTPEGWKVDYRGLNRGLYPGLPR
ncbi:MAG: hypothetical protein ACK4XJ_03925 [Fimbriimonadaceae bacterium]